MKTLSIVVPCFNEEATIRQILERVLAVSIPGWQTEVVVVDDCSTDRTQEILRSFGTSITAVRLTQNGGKGTAVKKGLELVTGDFVLIQDADLEYSPEEIPSLVAAIKGDRSVVYGSRNHRGSSRKGFWIPRLGVWFLTELANLLYGTRLTDIWTCYKLFPHSAKGHFVSGRFESEILFTLKLIRHGYRITEVPISHMPRPVGEGKKITYRDGFQSIALVLKDWFLHFPALITRGNFIWTMLAVLLVLFAGFQFLKPFPDPLGDTPSYVTAMEVLMTGDAPAGFVPTRILTTFGALQTVIALSVFSSNIFSSWIFLNSVFFLVASGIFYAIMRRIFASERVALLGTLFLAANYAMLSFGLNYLMDIGGWMFYLISGYYLLRYIESGRTRELWYSALAIGIGGLFKEYAFLACIPIAIVLIGYHFRSPRSLFKRAVPAALLALAPTLFVHAFVYVRYGYSYADWLGFNESYYVYSSRAAEYIKSFGSLFNVLGIIFLGGLYCLVREARKLVDCRYHIFILGLALSVVPIFVWPAITQRILFITVPLVIVIAGFFMKRYEHLWYVFLPVLALYIWISFNMNWLLTAVNLPF